MTATDQAILCPCANWARELNLEYLTNHHPNCQHYNDSLMDVWKMTVNGGAPCYFDSEQDVISASEEEYEDETTITKERMHREVFEHLPEFQGF